MTVNGIIECGSLHATGGGEELDYPYTAEEGVAFILGDDGVESEDRRTFRPIFAGDIEDKALNFWRGGVTSFCLRRMHAAVLCIPTPGSLSFLALRLRVDALQFRIIQYCTDEYGTKWYGMIRL